MTVIELAPSFGGEVAAIHDFLGALGVVENELWHERDTAAACAVWSRHVVQRRAGESARRPVADVLSGAFAERFDGLMTRNGADFRRLFPSLKIEVP